MLVPGKDARKDIMKTIADARRGLDRYWIDIDGSPDSRLLVLLPLASGGAVQGFLQRVDDICNEHLGASLPQLGWSVRFGELESGSADELVALVRTGTLHAG